MKTFFDLSRNCKAACEATRIYSFLVWSSCIPHILTRTRQDTYDPKFATQIETEYHFEKKQKLVFKILDVDNPGAPLAPGGSQVCS